MNITKTIFHNRFWWVLLATAVLVGLLYGLPQFLIWKKLHDLGQSYVLLQLTHHSDEASGTAARYREVYDGHFLPGDLYLNKNGALPFGPFPITVYIMAIFLYLFRGSMNAAFLAAHFALPPILFLLFYWLGKVVTGKRAWAFFFGLVGVLTPIFNHLPFPFRSGADFLNIIAKNFYPLVQTLLPDLFLARTEDPLLTYLILLPVMTVLILFWRQPGRKNAIWLAVGLGLMFYTYFHYWVFLTIVFGLMLVLAFIQRRQHPERFTHLLLTAGLLPIITLPYWINFFLFRGLPAAAEITQRIGVTAGRYFHLLEPFPIVFDYLFYLLLGGLVYFVFFRKAEQKNTAWLYWVFLAAMFLVWNIQLVVGYVPHPDHWFRAVSPFLFIILFHLVYELSRRWNYKKAVAVLVLLSLLLISKKIVNAAAFVNPGEGILKDYSFSPAMVASWRWINKNLPGEPKIISPSFVTGMYLYDQTATRPYLIGGINNVESNAELEERFLTVYKIFGVPPEILARVLKGDKQDWCADGRCPDWDYHLQINVLKPAQQLYLNYYKYQPGRPIYDVYRYVTEEKAQELAERYRALQVTWQDIGADYVYWGPWEKQLSPINPAKDSHLERIFKRGEVEIYKIKK